MIYPLTCEAMGGVESVTPILTKRSCFSTAMRPNGYFFRAVHFMGLPQNHLVEPSGNVIYLPSTDICLPDRGGEGGGVMCVLSVTIKQKRMKKSHGGEGGKKYVIFQRRIDSELW